MDSRVGGYWDSIGPDYKTTLQRTFSSVADSNPYLTVIDDALKPIEANTLAFSWDQNLAGLKCRST